MWYKVVNVLMLLCVWALAMGGLIQALINRDHRDDDWEE